MGKKIRVGILFGGKSAEHEVSLQSAGSIVAAIDKEKYQVVLIGISKSGEWFLSDDYEGQSTTQTSDQVKIKYSGTRVTVVPGKDSAILLDFSNGKSLESPDVFFPVLHGPFGEDGTIQGLLKLANVPFVGAGVLGSAVGMDKDVMKRLLRDAGIPIAKFLAFNFSNRDRYNFKKIKAALGLPFFVKPANLGSSVGISKVSDEIEFEKSIKEAFNYDSKILIEENIIGREIECSVLGNETPIASVPGEVIPQLEFYSYKAKYIDEKGANLEIPAKLPDGVIKRVQELALNTFTALCCEGMARVDFFVRNESEVIVNELNSIPGFTNISMYPKLWEKSGISYTELIDRLIQLALERFKREQRLKTTFDVNTEVR